MDEALKLVANGRTRFSALAIRPKLMVNFEQRG